MKALGEFIVVMQGEKASERKGIFLPDSAQEQSNKAEVIAVGPDVKHIKVGDTILIPLLTLMRVANTHICDLMIDDRPALVLKEEDVAVVWPCGEAF
jgi:co-chaperonin GroES (HSP10)